MDTLQHPHLRGDDHRVTVAARRHPRADDLLRIASGVPFDPGRIHICRVDEVAARFDEGVEHVERGLAVDRPSEDVPAEADR